MQRLTPGSSRGSPPYFPGSVMRASAPPQALGYRRALPTKDHELLWDEQGTIFLLSKAEPALWPQGLAAGRLQRHSSSHVLCQGAKDVRRGSGFGGVGLAVGWGSWIRDGGS